MVNSGSFDSASDGNRNGKTRCTQPSDSDDAACKSDCSKSADGDLPSDESAIEPTPTKTEINSNMPSSTAPLECESSPSLPLEKIQSAANISSPENTENKVKHQARKRLCLYCDRSFVSANLRQKHVERVHSVKHLRRVSARRQNQLSTTPCAHCDKLNTPEHTLSDLFQHLVQEHPTKYFGCLTCEEKFLTAVDLVDHNRLTHPTIEASSSFNTNLVTTSQQEDAVSSPSSTQKVTRSKLRCRTSELATDDVSNLRRKKKSKLKELRNKKISVKSSKIAIKRSKRLQQQAKEVDVQKRRREKKLPTSNKLEVPSPSTKQPEKSKTASVNPFPEFDHFYRVKKITDHSIDNLKISSLTFDDVFDKAFFNRIKCNIEENLLHHIDGKLFKNEESESRISNFEKLSTATQEVQNANSGDNYGCEISLNAITPASSLSLNSQFGEDFESQIEYGSKPSKKRTQIKSDEVHYKYFTRRKYQASILQQKENRDLSKLDMWTQMVVKDRQERVLNNKKSAKEMQEYTTCQEYRSKIKREELNRILDRRGPFEDLKEEASKKAAFDKLNSSSDNNISQEVFTHVREVLNDLLNRVFEAVAEDDGPLEVSCKEIDQREIPAYLDLRRKTSSTQEEIDKSDRIALICSSQETENFELPTNTVRSKNEIIELTGEWARRRMYICAACGGKFSNMRYLVEHKSIYHQNVWVQHYEFVGNQGELYRHLSIPGLGKVGIVEETVPCKQWKRSDARTCTKCGKQCNALGELHRHVLECGGDWTWMLARKKCKYRPFGAKTRRKLRGFEPRIRIHNKRKTEPLEKKKYKKPIDGPRQRPSDADTIQRMLANLPPKRSRRSLISLSDVVFKSRKRNNSTNTKKHSKTKVKCGKALRKKQQADVGFHNSNQQRTGRTLRSFNKVLSSRILDLNSSLLVKRKILRNHRLTRHRGRPPKNYVEHNVEEMTIDEGAAQKKRKSPKKDAPSFKEPEKCEEVSSLAKPKRMLNTRLNLKNFFPVKKKNIKQVQKSSEIEKIPADSRDNNDSNKNSEYNFQHMKKNKRGGLKGFVRALSLRKRNSKEEDGSIESSVPSKKNIRSKAKEKSDEENSKQSIPGSDSVSSEVLSKKRKLQRSFRNVINKVKKVKTETTNLKKSTPFLEEGAMQEESPPPEKLITLAEAQKEAPAPTVNSNISDSKENPPIPETIFNLETSEEKNLQAKGELDFDVKHQSNTTDTDISKISPVAIDTSLKPKCVPLVSPNIKGKIRKPSRGLNDCIAMLTSKLQQKDDKMSSSLESLFSTSSTTSIEPRTEKPVEPKMMIVKPESVPKISSLNDKVEETALDLSKKSVSTPNLLLSIPDTDMNRLPPTWNSVDDIIQQVVNDSSLYVFNKPKSRTKVDDTIDFVVNSSLDWFESKCKRKTRRKKHSDDNLITNIIFGKDKLIIAPSSDPKNDFENPLIAKIKENEYRMAHLLSGMSNVVENDETIKTPTISAILPKGTEQQLEGKEGSINGIIELRGSPKDALVENEGTLVVNETPHGGDPESTSRESQGKQNGTLLKKRGKTNTNPVIETDLDNCMNVKEVSPDDDKHISGPNNVDAKCGKLELITESEPVLLENKPLKLSSDSEDEIPLAVIAKFDDNRLSKQNSEEAVESSSPGPVVDDVKLPGTNTSPSNDSNKDIVEALTTDSLKENIEETTMTNKLPANQTKILKTRRRKKRRKLLFRNKKTTIIRVNNNKSLQEQQESTLLAKNICYPPVPEGPNQEITNTEHPSADTESKTPECNSQRTRRKSKSSKKITDKTEDDLFKNFSLVINKKTKRIPPTSIVDDSVCDDDINLFAKPPETSKDIEDTPLNDSVEEMDMEIEDIPINISIIERDDKQLVALPSYCNGGQEPASFSDFREDVLLEAPSKNIIEQDYLADKCPPASFQNVGFKPVEAEIEHQKEVTEHENLTSPEELKQVCDKTGSVFLLEEEPRVIQCPEGHFDESTVYGNGNHISEEQVEEETSSEEPKLRVDPDSNILPQPPEYPPMADGNKNIVLESLSEDERPLNESTPKKKRGRPRKKKSSENDSADNEISSPKETVTTPPKNKAGSRARTRKSPRSKSESEFLDQNCSAPCPVGSDKGEKLVKAPRHQENNRQFEPALSVNLQGVSEENILVDQPLAATNNVFEETVPDNLETSVCEPTKAASNAVRNEPEFRTSPHLHSEKETSDGQENDESSTRKLSANAPDSTSVDRGELNDVEKIMEDSGFVEKESPDKKPKEEPLIRSVDIKKATIFPAHLMVDGYSELDVDKMCSNVNPICEYHEDVVKAQDDCSGIVVDKNNTDTEKMSHLDKDLAATVRISENRRSKTNVIRRVKIGRKHKKAKQKDSSRNDDNSGQPITPASSSDGSGEINRGGDQSINDSPVKGNSMLIGQGRLITTTVDEATILTDSSVAKTELEAVTASQSDGASMAPNDIVLKSRRPRKLIDYNEDNLEKRALEVNKSLATQNHKIKKKNKKSRKNDVNVGNFLNTAANVHGDVNNKLLKEDVDLNLECKTIELVEVPPANDEILIPSGREEKFGDESWKSEPVAYKASDFSEMPELVVDIHHTDQIDHKLQEHIVKTNAVTPDDRPAGQVDNPGNNLLSPTEEIVCSEHLDNCKYKSDKRRNKKNRSKDTIILQNGCLLNNSVENTNNQTQENDGRSELEAKDNSFVPLDNLTSSELLSKVIDDEALSRYNRRPRKQINYNEENLLSTVEPVAATKRKRKSINCSDHVEEESIVEDKVDFEAKIAQNLDTTSELQIQTKKNRKRQDDFEETVSGEEQTGETPKKGTSSDVDPEITEIPVEETPSDYTGFVVDFDKKDLQEECLLKSPDSSVCESINRGDNNEPTENNSSILNPSNESLQNKSIVRLNGANISSKSVLDVVNSADDCLPSADTSLVINDSESPLNLNNLEETVVFALKKQKKRKHIKSKLGKNKLSNNAIIKQSKIITNYVDNDNSEHPVERQCQLAKINIKNLLLSSLAPPKLAAANSELNVIEPINSTEIRLKNKKDTTQTFGDSLQDNINFVHNNKSLLNESLTFTALKDVLNTFTNSCKTSSFTKSDGMFSEIQPLTEIITSSEMDIAPVLDEIDKSLECDDIYDFTEDIQEESYDQKVTKKKVKNKLRLCSKTTEDVELTRASSRPAKVKALESIHEKVVTESEQSIITTSTTHLKKSKKRLKSLNDTTDKAVDEPKTPEDIRQPEFSMENHDVDNSVEDIPPENIDEDGAELRRSRRGSRKVPSYNENDLIDPLIDALEKRRSRSSRKDRSTEKHQIKTEPANGNKPKLRSSEELFDLLKKSSSTDKPAKCFVDELNSTAAYQDRTESVPGKWKDVDKIYEFTEDSPENTGEIKELFGKNKKKPKQQSLTDEIKVTADLMPESNDSDHERSNYCDICKKSFIRVENLIKHKTTLTHISKLSELEAKAAEEKAKLDQHQPTSPEATEINLTDILQQSEQTRVTEVQEECAPIHNNHSLKLVDIINDVLNKPVIGNYSPDMCNVHDQTKGDVRRYKSLGERKSFESENHLTPLNAAAYLPPALSKTSILENQINLLENIIGNNLDNITSNKHDEVAINNSFIDEISSCSNISNATDLDNKSVVNVEINNCDADFVKPTQYEEISEDSTNARTYEDPKQRKTLNRDEELFLECCSLLKSGSEVSNSINYSKTTKKPLDCVKEFDEPDLPMENKKLIQTAEEAHEYSDNSRTPTPLGDTYDDDASNSNTISSNWHLKSEKPMDKNRSFSFEEVKSKEAAGMPYGEMLTEGLRHQFENVQAKPNERSPNDVQDLLEINRPTDDKKDDSDCSTASKKVATKGARKVYEGLKVSIPTEDLDLEVLNSKKIDVKTDASSGSKPRSTRKSKPVKKSQVGSNLLFKVNKKKSPTQLGDLSPAEQQEDIYNFEETQDNTEIFIKPTLKDYSNSTGPEVRKGNALCSDNESLGYADSIGADAKSVSSVSSISAMSAKKPEVAPENITKKKYKIMGKIFRNAAKSKMDDIDEELRSIPEIPEIDNLELVENYVRSCQRVKSPFLPPPPPPPIDDLPQKPKMTEEEMNMLFDQLLGKEVNESKPEKTANKSTPKSKNAPDNKKKNGKVKHRKRARGHSESSDDEFNINRTAKKRSNKKNNQEDSGINLELELKECIGVASRKSQRTCTSGKQNILVEYWSSDEEAFEAMLESHKIPTKKEPEEVPRVFEKPSDPAPKPKPTKKKRSSPLKKSKPVSAAKVPEANDAAAAASNRRKRAAVNPLYHWSSSSEDESQSLIEVKPIREEDDEDDRPIQHGWIVGDSPKKLVTMLALTKGKKTDIDCVKEQGKRRTSNNTAS